MSLPAFSSGIYWNDYRNSTPTFELTPVEKPDFSPFLIHMTGRKSLLNILKGINRNGEGEDIANQGFLEAVIPVSDGKSYYNSKVVCFTETPIFALDFFRYRSFRRWQDDQQYGIGFAKTDLIKHHSVRPVIYLDTKTNRTLLSLCNKIKTKEYVIKDSNEEVQEFKNLFSQLESLMFPLLEDTRHQGFMWEREWRCTNDQGMSFPHKMIKVICCPASEKSGIVEFLGELAQGISIVESWKEYDEVTNYLKRREKETKSDFSVSAIKDIETLKQLKSQNEQTKETLLAYSNVFRTAADAMAQNGIDDLIKGMAKRTNEIDNQIARLTLEHKNKISRETAEKIRKMLDKK